MRPQQTIILVSSMRSNIKCETAPECHITSQTYQRRRLPITTPTHGHSAPTKPCSCVLPRLLLTVTARVNPFLPPTVLACGVVPLKQLVLAHTAKQSWTTLKLNLELNGLPAGEHVVITAPSRPWEQHSVQHCTAIMGPSIMQCLA
jgi:hypothetical protein